MTFKIKMSIMQSITVDELLTNEFEIGVEDKLINKVPDDDCEIKIYMSMLLIILTSPLTVLDIYYAFTDDSCITEYAGISVNLFQYLLVDGLTNIVLALMFLNNLWSTVLLDGNNCIKYVYIVIIYLLSLFQFAWLILGAVIFWGLIDTSLCSKSLYTFMYCQLIIKIVSYVYYIVMQVTKKNEYQKNNILY